MAVLQAPGRQQGRAIEQGIRPFDISRDLRPVAELIAMAFASELDDHGHSALREMRMMSHLGGVLGVMNRSTGEFNDMLSGFVWVEAGKVVGNVTVQRADKSASRWQIANVAVAPAFRGRGISRQLMEAAVDHAARCGGQWVVLQVYARNEVARHLYATMGFEALGGMVDLQAEQLPPITPPLADPNLAAFQAADWQPLYELANSQLGARAQWWRAIRRADFQPAFEDPVSEWFHRVIGKQDRYRRAIQHALRFEAALILTAMRWQGQHQMQLWVRPEHYGVHDETLIRWGLVTLQGYPRWPVNISVATEHTAALDLLQYYRFHIQRTLLTLRKQIGAAVA